MIENQISEVVSASPDKPGAYGDNRFIRWFYNIPTTTVEIHGVLEAGCGRIWPAIQCDNPFHGVSCETAIMAYP